MNKKLQEKLIEKVLLNDLSEETIGDESTAFEVGKSYFFRTVTYFVLGKIVHITKDEFVLENASWIADTGRFSDFIKKGISNSVEVEPTGDHILMKSVVVDAMPWKRDLPTTQQ